MYKHNALIKVLMAMASISSSVFATQIYKDATFGNNGRGQTQIGTKAQANALTLASDGKVIVAGQADINGVSQIFLARYTNGILDTSFGTNGITLTSAGTSADAIATQADGGIIISGYSFIPSVLLPIIARYSTTGIIDNGFGSSGIASDLIGTRAAAKSVLIQPDQKIIILGSTDVNGVNQLIAWRYTDSGVLDNSFGDNGHSLVNIGLVDAIGAGALQSDGSIVAAGSTVKPKPPYNISPASSRVAAVAKISSSGTIDTTFGVNGIFVYAQDGSIDDHILACAVQPDDKIVLAGRSQINGVGNILLIRLTPSGALDNTFGTNGVVIMPIDSVNATGKVVIIQPDLKIIVAGQADNHPVIARYTSDGLLDSTFGQNGVVQDEWANTDYVSSGVLASDGKIIVAGAQDSAITIAKYAQNNADMISILSPQNAATIVSNTITVNGVSSQSGLTVSLSLDGNSVGTGTTDNDGLWSIALGNIITNGSHTLTADLKNGSTTLASASVSFSTNGADAISISSPSESQVINTLTPTFTGYTSASNGVVRLSVDGTVVATISADSNGLWQTTSSRLTNGNHILLAELMVNGSAVAQSTKNFSVNVYPPFVAISAPALGSTITTNTTAISGYSSQANIELQILIDGQLFEVIQTDLNGNWSTGTTNSLANGKHNIVIMATDQSGSVSIASSIYFTVNV